MDEIDEQDDRERMGLNDQGFGAVAMPPASGAAPLPGHRLQDLYGPMIPRADRQVQANPLTGILEAVPTQQAPMSPQQHDPWVAQQVQNIERSMDLLQQRQDLNPLQMRHALMRKQRQMQQIDPQGFYRRGGPASQLNSAEKWAAQNVFKDPNTGLIFYNDGRTWKHIEPKDHALEIKQKWDEHRMAMAEKFADMRAQAAKDLADFRKGQLELHGKVADLNDKFKTGEAEWRHGEATKKHELRAAEFESRHPEWKATEEAWRRELNNGATLFQKHDKNGNALPPDDEVRAQAAKHAKSLHADLWERFQRVQKEREAWRKKHEDADESGGEMGKAHEVNGVPEPPTPAPASPPPLVTKEEAVNHVKAAKDREEAVHEERMKSPGFWGAFADAGNYAQ